MINIENLHFSYSGHMVFSDINMNLESGKIYGLLGENGVGKTTLLKIIGGFLKVKKGRCEVMNHNPFKREPSFLQEVIYIPEDFSAPDLVIEEYARLRGQFYPKYDKEKFIQLLSLFGVDSSKKFTRLSHGQQKKAIIAFSVATNTKLLLLDEPSNGLDIPSKSQLRQVISEISTDENCIIISTHQVRDLENLIDPIIILDREDVLLKESVENITDKLSFIYTPVPSKTALYNETTPGGYLAVELNTTGEESRVNIEALFNATLNNKETIKNIFKR